MRYEFLIAFRYIFTKRREKFISAITAISILGIAVGVATLIATLAVMSGFDSELKNRIIGSSPHIYIEKEFGIEDVTAVAERINSVKGVKGSFPYVNSQAMIEFRNRARGIVLKSVDPKNKTDANKLLPYLVSGASGAIPDQGLIIGSELASSIGVYVDDEVKIITPGLQRPRAMKVSGIFKSGMYDYDANIVYTSLEGMLSTFNAATVSGIGVDCVMLSDCPKIAGEIQKRLGANFAVSTWIDRNRNLFSAIKLEKLAMFVILTFIVIVACFSIVGALVMTVIEKKKDIGILKAIGVPKKGIIAIFSIQGLVMGFLGVCFGSAGGVGASFLIKNFIHLPAEVYYIDSIPIKFKVFDSIVIILAALIISLVAAIYPAYRASKLDPAEALRYE